MNREDGFGHEPGREQGADARGIVVAALRAHIEAIEPSDMRKAVVRRGEDPERAARLDKLTQALVKISQGRSHEVAVFLDDELRGGALSFKSEEHRRALRDIVRRDAAAAGVSVPEFPVLESRINPAKERLLRERRDQLAVELKPLLVGATGDTHEFLSRIIKDLEDPLMPDVPTQLVLRLQAGLGFESPLRAGIIAQAEELVKIEKES